MSNAHYRYYNSNAGVGILIPSREEGDFTYIAARIDAARPAPWVKTTDLYESVEAAKGQPVAEFFAKKPEMQKQEDLSPGL